MKHIEKINTPQEYSNLLDKIISHAANVRGATIILRKLYQGLPSVMKEEELDEMSAMSFGAVEAAPKKEETLEEDGWDEPHV